MQIQKAPVAIFIFNRPENVSEVMKQIRSYKPKSLLIIADGPRQNRDGERELCEKARQEALNVDWDCEVHTNFSEVNLGCKQRLVSGLNWVFEIKESAIILEDDCVPHPSFFPYAQEMLDRFRDDTKIGMISGDNYLFDEVPVANSYYFSRYAHIWGWATWGRAWSLYDSEMSSWKSLSPQDKSAWLNKHFDSPGERKHWLHAFKRVTEDHLDTWDYQWAFTMQNNSLLSVVPKHNLIGNIGIATGATHTTKPNLESTAEVNGLNFPLITVEGKSESHKPADEFESKLFYRRTIFGRLRRNIYAARRIKRLKS